MKVSGGGLPDTFTVGQMHLHWAQNGQAFGNGGSEQGSTDHRDISKFSGPKFLIFFVLDQSVLVRGSLDQSIC